MALAETVQIRATVSSVIHVRWVKYQNNSNFGGSNRYFQAKCTKAVTVTVSLLEIAVKDRMARQ